MLTREIHGLARYFILKEMFAWFKQPAAPATPSHVPDEMLIFDTISPPDQPFVDLFKKQVSSFWSSDELKFPLDASDMQKLDPKARKLFEYILAFFATADGEVLENAVVNFLAQSESLSIRMAYTAQVFFESIHIQTYAAAMTAYIPDTAKRMELTMAFKTDPLIKERDEWMSKYIEPYSGPADKMALERHKAKQLVAFACAEGLFFMSAFMVIMWLRSRDLFPKFARANEFISRDEWMHVQLGIARYRRFYRSRLTEIGLTEEDILNVVRESVELESRFATALIPASTDEDKFSGLRLEDAILNIQNHGNVIVDLLGISTKVWKDADPKKLPVWVNFVGLQPKTNFYEGEVTSYTTPVAESEDPNRDVDF